MTHRILLIALLVAAPALLVGCDALEDAVGLDDIEVATGAAGQLDLLPDSTTTASATVTINQDLPDAVDVEELDIPASSVSYTPTGALMAHSGAAACVIDIDLFVDGSLVLDGSVTVDESASPFVRDVSFPAPTAQQLETLSAAIQDGTFTLRLDAANSGSCDGVLAVDPLVLGFGL